MDAQKRTDFEGIAKEAVAFLDAYKGFHDALTPEERATPNEALLAVINLGRTATKLGLYTKDPNAARKNPTDLEPIDLLALARSAQNAVEEVSADAVGLERTFVDLVERRNGDDLLARLGRVEAGFAKMNIITPQVSEVYGRYRIEETMALSTGVSFELDVQASAGRRNQLEAVAESAISFLSTSYRTGLMEDVSASANASDDAAERLRAVRDLQERLEGAGYRLPKSAEDATYDYFDQKPSNAIEDLVRVRDAANRVREAFDKDGGTYVADYTWAAAAFGALKGTLSSEAQSRIGPELREQIYIRHIATTIQDAADHAMNLTLRAEQNVTPSTDGEYAPRSADRTVRLPARIDGQSTEKATRTVIDRVKAAGTYEILAQIEAHKKNDDVERTMAEEIVRLSNRLNPGQFAAVGRLLDAVESLMPMKREEEDFYGDRARTKAKVRIEGKIGLSDDRGYLVEEDKISQLNSAASDLVSSGAYKVLAEFTGRGPHANAVDNLANERVFSREELTVDEATAASEEAIRLDQEARLRSGRALKVGRTVVPMEMDVADYARIPEADRARLNVMMATPDAPLFKDYDGLAPGTAPRGAAAIWAQNRAIGYVKDVLVGEDKEKAKTMSRELAAAEARPIVANTRAEAMGIRKMSDRVVLKSLQDKRARDADRNRIREGDEVVRAVFRSEEVEGFMRHVGAVAEAAVLVKMRGDRSGTEVMLKATTREGAEIKPVFGRIEGESSIARMRDNQSISVVPPMRLAGRQNGTVDLVLVNQRVVDPAILERESAQARRDGRRNTGAEI